MPIELPVIPSVPGDTLTGLALGARCRQLLSKGLYINAGLPKGEEIAGDGNFWCGKTQTIFGPDKGLCNGDLCRIEGRSCHES